MRELTRRDFLAVTASSGLAAGNFSLLNDKFLVSQNQGTPATPPGEWSFWATACRECPAGCGMYTWYRDGRSTKAEGLPGHPLNEGTLCPRGQSAVQGHYDPDRIQSPYRGAQLSWAAALDELAAQFRERISRVLILSHLETGALAEVMAAFASAVGVSSQVVFYEPLNYQEVREANNLLFGKPVIPFYHVDQGSRLLSLGVDFLETWVSPIQFARQYTRFRESENTSYTYVGPRLSMTAANADHVHLMKPSQMVQFAMAVVGRVAELNSGPDTELLRKITKITAAGHGVNEVVYDAIEKTATSLASGKGLALGGPTGGAGNGGTLLAVAAGLLSAATGAKSCVDLTRPHALSHTATFETVRSALKSVDDRTALLVFHANPVYSLPEIAGDIGRAGLSIFVGTLANETAQACQWVLPVDSPLEMWGDYEPYPGIHNLMQPVTNRLYDTRDPGTILLELANRLGKPLRRSDTAEAPASYADWLMSRWRDVHARVASDTPFEDFWRGALHSGGVWEETVPTAQPDFSPDIDRMTRLFSNFNDSLGTGGLELWLWPSVNLFDGRTANRGWLQEMPEPVSYLAWGSWLDVHSADAEANDLRDGDVVTVASGDTGVQAPVRVTEDVSQGVAAIAFGQGHSAPALTARGVGVNAFLLRQPNTEPFFGHAQLMKTGNREALCVGAATQEQHDRHLLQWVGDAPQEHGRPEPIVMPLPEGYDINQDLYPARLYTFHRWAMAIDLNRCIGCGACAIACYAENNIGIVGRADMLERRELAWLKVVPYRHPSDKGRLAFLPLPCQQCDVAPCEPVCPVFASVHNEEGLNAQVYNRCIGTRYCSNNCPYKVRRFNWSNLEWRYPLTLQLNPDVTVRCRGVMEKCTFCIQRIRRVEHIAAREGRPIRDGEIIPACAQTCPARAIVFGDLLDDNSIVSRLFRTDPRRYQVLKELNTKPAIVYLQRVIGAETRNTSV